MAENLLSVFIYDHSLVYRHVLERIVRDYAVNNDIELGLVISAAHPNEILNHSVSASGLYFLNIDDLEKTMDGIKFALAIRDNDCAGSIVFISEHDIFMTGRADLAIQSLSSHVMAMSFLAKDSAQYENELRECLAVHNRKMSASVDRLLVRR